MNDDIELPLLPAMSAEILFSREQLSEVMQAYAREAQRYAWNAAVERAANICYAEAYPTERPRFGVVVDAIRALKEGTL